ncbi:MAG: hypothetical protein GC150_07580 [Rhizobiales bacterium]|nr:hypothetical protein [Hyphomicrobiales bacterium]
MSDLSSRIAAKAKEMKTRKPPVEPPRLITPVAAPEPKGEGRAVSASTDNVTEAATREPTDEARPAYREGRRNISAYHTESVFRQFKILAAETDKTVQELHREALNLLFRHHGKPPIA